MPANALPQLVPLFVQVFVGLCVGALFAWIAFVWMGDLETRIDYRDLQPDGKLPALTVALMPPGTPDPARPRVAVTLRELNEFLKNKPGHRIRLPIGNICWPERRTHGVFITCATVTPMLDGSQKIEVVETKETKLSEYRSFYTVSDKGITPQSYHLKNELHTMMRMAGAAIALAFGLWLGFRLGGRVARKSIIGSRALPPVH
jgi:hypothetical protein